MKRVGRVAYLREGAESEYDRHHSAVWPKVLEAINDSGIRNYSIFRRGRWLFSYYELPDGVTMDSVTARILKEPDCLRWEELMQKLQETLPDSGEGVAWAEMPEVFHADGKNGVNRK